MARDARSIWMHGRQEETLSFSEKQPMEGDVTANSISVGIVRWPAGRAPHLNLYHEQELKKHLPGSISSSNLELDPSLS
ncbi:hypothetical protein AAC387_Pa05g0516 [Persea americana]